MLTVPHDQTASNLSTIALALLVGGRPMRPLSLARSLARTAVGGPGGSDGESLLFKELGRGASSFDVALGRHTAKTRLANHGEGT
jgi:hypothetical protein